MLGPWLAGVTVRLVAGYRVAGHPGAVTAPGVRTRRTASARVSVSTALVTAVLFAGAALLTGPRPVLVGLVWVAGSAVVLAGVDTAVHRLPDVVVLPALGVLAAAVVVDAVAVGTAQPALDGLWCALVAFGVAALLRLLRPDALGFGDVKLLAVLGLALGWRGGGALLVTGVFLGLLAGALGALVLVALRRAGWRSAVPFGPPLLVGTAAAFALAGPL